MRTATLMLFVIFLSAALSAQTSWEAAFQGSNGDLWVVNSSNFPNNPATNTGLAMMAGTSPSITGLAGGAWDAAFQDASGDLAVASSSGSVVESQFSMKAGTSPSISALQ
jgi:hypothetical protein